MLHTIERASLHTLRLGGLALFEGGGHLHIAAHSRMWRLAQPEWRPAYICVRVGVATQAWKEWGPAQGTTL